MEKRLGIIRTDCNILREMLLLPNNADIVDISVDHTFNPPRVFIKVESPDFPITGEGIIRWVTPSYHHITQTKTEFLEWRL